MPAWPGTSERPPRAVADLRAMAEATLRYWGEALEHSAASKKVQVAIGLLPAALAGIDAQVITAARRLACRSMMARRPGSCSGAGLIAAAYTAMSASS